MNEHMRLIREGLYRQAQIVLELLGKGKVTLGLDDDSFAVEMLCEKLKCRIRYDSRGYIAEVHL